MPSELYDYVFIWIKIIREKQKRVKKKREKSKQMEKIRFWLNFGIFQYICQLEMHPYPGSIQITANIKILYWPILICPLLHKKIIISFFDIEQCWPPYSNVCWNYFTFNKYWQILLDVHFYLFIYLFFKECRQISIDTAKVISFLRYWPM